MYIEGFCVHHFILQNMYFTCGLPILMHQNHDIGYISNIKALVLVVSEKNIFMISQGKSLC